MTGINFFCFMYGQLKIGDLIDGILFEKWHQTCFLGCLLNSLNITSNYFHAFLYHQKGNVVFIFLNQNRKYKILFQTLILYRKLETRISCLISFFSDKNNLSKFCVFYNDQSFQLSPALIDTTGSFFTWNLYSLLKLNCFNVFSYSQVINITLSYFQIINRHNQLFMLSFF